MADDAPTSPRPAEGTTSEAPKPEADAIAAPAAVVSEEVDAKKDGTEDAAPPADKKEADDVAAADSASAVEEAGAPKANGDDKEDATASSPQDEASAAPAVTAAAATLSAKKTPKLSRRKSLASFKKGGAAAPNPDIKYDEGQYVLAKMRSFPPWPALVLNKDLLPEVMRVGKPKSLETIGAAAWDTQYPIFYLGTYE